MSEDAAVRHAAPVKSARRSSLSGAEVDADASEVEPWALSQRTIIDEALSEADGCAARAARRDEAPRVCAALIETTADRDADDVVADMLVSMPVVRCRLRCSAACFSTGRVHVTRGVENFIQNESRSGCNHKPYEKRSIL